MVSKRGKSKTTRKSPAESFGNGESPFPPCNDTCGFINTRLFTIPSVQPHAVPYGNRSFGIRRLCGIDDTLRIVGATEAKKL